MIYFFNKQECKDILQVSKKLIFDKNIDFGTFTYSFINESWVLNKVVKVFETNMKMKVLENPSIRIIKIDVNGNIPTHSFNYKSGEYKNTTFGSYIILNNDVVGGDIYRKGNKIEKQEGFGIIEPVDVKLKISRVTKGILYLIVVNFFNLDTTQVI